MMALASVIDAIWTRMVFEATRSKVANRRNRNLQNARASDVVDGSGLSAIDPACDST
jgi:hypothetical protein